MSQDIHSQTSPHSMVQRFADLARRRHLFGPGDRIVVAVSGGPDSVALLSLFSELVPRWKLDLCALHMNHGLRAEESDQDQEFVARLCKQLGIKLQVERISLTSLMQLRKGHSLQECAREARYSTMQVVGQSVGAKRIALGHTADDQAETVLMWMLRGSGARGLAGIPPTREGIFIRPLLEFRRGELTSYLEAKGLSFRTDSSNASSIYFRNRIRHELLPTLHRFNPAIVEALCRQAEILREEDHCLDELTVEHLNRSTVEEEPGAVTLDRSQFLALPLAVQRRLVRSLVRRLSGILQGPSFQAVSDILEKVIQGPTGAALSVHGAHVSRNYHRIRFRVVRGDSTAPDTAPVIQLPLAKEGIPLPIPSALSWPPTHQLIQVSMKDPAEVERALGTETSRTSVMLDADRFTKELRVRTWQPGDTFLPLGLDGHSKKLQDFFSDMKLPRDERHRIPLIVAPEGILWVVGYRADHRFCRTPSTRHILLAEVKRPRAS